jgi:hypothetical protein
LDLSASDFLFARALNLPSLGIPSKVAVQDSYQPINAIVFLEQHAGQTKKASFLEQFWGC